MVPQVVAETAEISRGRDVANIQRGDARVRILHRNILRHAGGAHLLIAELQLS